MRGKQAHRGIYSEKHRNIPAYAGKTRRRQSVASSSKEHPRVCGENSSDLDIQGIPPGTSPRMRGKPNRPHFYGAGERNIPAYAGKTCIRFGRCAVAPEHPRVCGENLDGTGIETALGGTSPRMRGKRARRRLQRFGRRNIPAYAGKTFWCGSSM